MTTFTKNSFLFPTAKKLILAATLFFVFGWIVWPTIITSLITDWYPVGFPFTIHAIGLCAGTCIDFRWVALVIDGAFWYFLSAMIFRARIRFWMFCVYFIIVILAIWLITALYY